MFGSKVHPLNTLRNFSEIHCEIAHEGIQDTRPCQLSALAQHPSYKFVRQDHDTSLHTRVVHQLWNCLQS
jgi:hypothetical protein